MAAKRSWSSIASSVALAATLGATVNLLYESAIKDNWTGRFLSVDSTERTNERIAKAFSEIEAQNKKLEDIATAINRLPSDAQSRTLIAGFDERLKTIQARLKVIEDVIVQDPPKSLSLVVMKRDIADLQKSIDDKYSAQNLSIERLYNMFGWSLGALIIAVAAQIMAGFFSRRRTDG